MEPYPNKKHTRVKMIVVPLDWHHSYELLRISSTEVDKMSCALGFL
jgi:hypothetical protein